jgi:hypothetical protein
MARRKARVLSPIGDPIESASLTRGNQNAETARGRSIGFIDNSKPNVQHVIGTLRQALRTAEKAEVISTTKPRSAGPSPDIAFLLSQCRLVVNGVAD